MALEFTKGVRENVSLLIALAGASGSGKTKSALRLAEGLAGGKPIAFIDTEARRGLHYADQHDFDHHDMRPPFRPQAFIDTIHAAERAGYGVVVIDSFTHEYEGEGGIVEWAQELERGGMKSPANWAKPKAEHKKLVGQLLQCRAHLIFCLRAEEKIEIVKDERGKTQVRPLGWTPLCEKRFMFEQTLSFTLEPTNPGKPNFRLPHKLQEQHRPMFPEGKFIDEEAGRLLAEWAAGGSPKPRSDDLDVDYLLTSGDETARLGLDALRSFWSKMSAEEKHAVGGAEQLAKWKKSAEAAGETTE